MMASHPQDGQHHQNLLILHAAWSGGVSPQLGVAEFSALLCAALRNRATAQPRASAPTAARRRRSKCGDLRTTQLTLHTRPHKLQKNGDARCGIAIDSREVRDVENAR
jgi:hypothetical protein